MKKLASDLTLPSDLFLIIMISSVSFFLGGLIGGVLLLSTEWPWPYLLEGAVGGLLLGAFLRRRYAVWLPILAGMLSIALGMLAASSVGLLIDMPFSLAMILGGAVAGAIFGGLLKAGRATLIFILVCAIGFSLGQVLLETFRQNFTAFYDWIAQIAGDNGGAVLDVGLMGLYQGFSFGLALALVVVLHRMEMMKS